ncbi:MAG TPA: LuxR C-terminal-related transcriptional regulator [Candidatus Eisenbacteria bacterium]|nr:LuxR C-terminal-related transcriptional regulator [Candidatus Eisenbacteria bacterium]
MAALLRNGALLRWAVVALVAVRVIAAPPRPAALGVLWVLSIASWNTAVLWLGERLAPARAARVAQAAVLADVIALVALVQIFASTSPEVVSGGAALVLLEAVICWGARGVLITAGLTMAALTAPEAAHRSPLYASLSWNDVGSEDVMIGLLSAALVMARRLLARPLGPPPAVEPQPPPSGLRMTTREREVLTLLAEGCSNTVIARRLQVTESTVKRHVESILNRLNARNRAGAVAAASRMGLLD